MVTHTCNKNIIFKDKTFIPIYSECNISMKTGSHSVAQITSTNNLGLKRTYTIAALNLHRYFKEFDSITQEDLDEAMYDGENYSIYKLADSGNLEPDGYDEFGFPSKTLAIM